MYWLRMLPSWTELLEVLDRHAPEGSTRRKLIQLLAVVLLFEGLSVILLSSKFGYSLGLASMALGVMLLVLFPPSLRMLHEEDTSVRAGPRPLGLSIVENVMARLGSDYVIIGIGMIIIASDLAFNAFLSTRPNYGDLDTLSIMFGATLMIYPFAVRKFRVEITFSLIFLLFVVILLVVPQAFIALESAEGSGVGNWYVHYMLAAPFAVALNLLGIHASSNEEWVTLTFHDGSVQTLGISTACAGLYSFSIFVSAFFAYVLVFERLPPKLMAAVLGIGLFAAYLGNLLRMIVIGVVGYFNGMDALLWAHKNVGWMVFLGWSAVFWYLVMRFAEKRARASATNAD